MADLKFVISAVDNASKALGQVGKETEKLGKGVAGLNAAARVISAGAIIAFGASSVKAFAEAEKSQVKLEQAYKRFPALADTNISSLRELNKALQDKTGADADSLAAAQATLAQFKLTGSQIEQLTPLLVDYAQTTGQDVTTAAQALGKAFMGNTKALKAIGVDFKATGDTAKDFQSIYAALEGQVGGAGEAFGQTTAGQLQILQASFEDLQEEVGAQLVPALKALVSVAKPILGAFGSLPEPVKGAAVAVGALAAAALLAGPRILALKAALQDAGQAGVVAGKGMKIAAAAAAAYTAALIASSAASRDGNLNTSEFAKSLDKLRDTGELTGEALRFFGEDAGALEQSIQFLLSPNAWESATKAIGKVTGALGLFSTENQATEAFQELDAALSQLVTSGNTAAAAQGFDLAREKAEDLGIPVEELKTLFPQYQAALDGASGSGATFSQVTGDLTEEAQNAEDAMSRLKSMIDELQGTQISAEQATMKVAEAIDKASEAAGENGRTLNMNTDEGRKNRKALQDIASAALDAVDAYVENGDSAETVADKTAKARDQFIKVAEKMGLGRVAAEKLATQYGLVPDSVETAVKATGVESARRAVGDLRTAIYGINDRTVTVRVNIDSRYKGKPVPIGEGATGGLFRNGRFHYDDGGMVTGPGTGTSDSVPAMLSNGEYVIRAAAVSRIGVDLLDDINDNGVIDQGALLGQRRVVSRAVSAADARAAENINIRTQILLDGKQLAESLANYKRSIGGRKLGLD